MFRLISSRAFGYHTAKPSTRQPLVKVANSRIQRTVRNRRHEETQIGVPHDKKSPIKFEPFPFAVTAENKVECVKRILTPLHDIPYEEQLSAKESFCRNALREFGQELYKNGTPVRLDVKRLPCHVNKIVPSQMIHKYRNKDEFSIWRGYDGETITVGHMIFPIGKHGDTVCVEPEGVDVIKDETVAMSRIIQEFMRNQAKLGTSFSLGVDGGWRRFMIRCNSQGELMLIGVLNPTTYRVREIIEERDNFRDFVVRRSQEENLKLISLYYQPCPNNSCTHRDVPYELLHGQRSLIETIGPYKFCLSPESYIHNSTDGAEQLYKTIKTTIQECFLNESQGANNKERQQQPLILNADCGSGSLAIYLSDIADVYGVDRNDLTIRDAQESATLNNINNCQFITAQFEIILERLLAKFSHEHGRQVIALCDVPTRGMHRNVIEVLRNCQKVDKLILVVPRIQSTRTMDTLLGLCSKPKLSRSASPFAPIQATPVDTCPLTDSFQTVIALERLPS